jgi:hypothetical protein
MWAQRRTGNQGWQSRPSTRCAAHAPGRSLSSVVSGGDACGLIYARAWPPCAGRSRGCMVLFGNAWCGSYAWSHSRVPGRPRANTRGLIVWLTRRFPQGFVQGRRRVVELLDGLTQSVEWQPRRIHTPCRRVTASLTRFIATTTSSATPITRLLAFRSCRVPLLTSSTADSRTPGRNPRNKHAHHRSSDV